LCKQHKAETTIRQRQVAQQDSESASTDSFNESYGNGRDQKSIGNNKCQRKWGHDLDQIIKKGEGERGKNHSIEITEATITLIAKGICDNTNMAQTSHHREPLIISDSKNRIHIHANTK
jgi:hypothetical protein